MRTAEVLCSQAAIAFFAALVIGLAVSSSASEAVAGACEYTKRTNLGNSPIEGKGVSAHTVVRSKGSTGTFDATIWRGSTQKASQTLQFGQQVGKLSNVAGQGDFTIAVVRSGATAARTCSFSVRLQTGIGGNEAYTEWFLGGCSNSGDGVDFQVSCSKSYHAGKQRWNTNFLITD